MADLAIRAERVSKQYRIGQLHAPYDTLREQLARLVRRDGSDSAVRTIWALRDVSFEIEHGEVVGIIGRNGAGKTTLLKILSRITEPTEGRAEMHGRLGSLLEVGTGFHPELTGRENVFLNGAILGMRRAEIARKFDEIVEFAGVEKFVDTPVKRYSSGMHVRLAFSVAAHLEPEILLVDEVLAVGDAEFQRRCLGKMEGIGRSGRTVLFVSHSMPTVNRLCGRALLLDAGRLIEDGPADRVVTRYLQSEHGSPAWRTWPDPDSAPGNETVRLRSLRVVDEELETVETIDVRRPVGIEIVLEILKRGPRFVPWIALYDDTGRHMFSAMDTGPAWREPREPSRYRSVAWIRENLLNEGGVVVAVSLLTFVAAEKSIRQAHVDNALSFTVVDPGEGDTARGHYGGHWPGPVRPFLHWTTERVDVPAGGRR